MKKIWLVLISILVVWTPVSSEERVPIVSSLSEFQDYNPYGTDSRVISVYTSQEIDARINPVNSKNSQQDKDIKNLLDKTAMLEKNVRDLADLNDALAKRIDELEKKIADTGDNGKR